MIFMGTTMVTQQRNRGREYKLLQIQPKDVSAFPISHPTASGETQTLLQAFWIPVIVLCVSVFTVAGLQSVAGVILSSDVTHAATAVELKSMAFFFFFF